MVLTYEAYVIHYASSSQPVTMCCLCVEAFCTLAKAKLRERTCWNVSLKCRLHWLILTALFLSISLLIGKWVGLDFKDLSCTLFKKKGKSRFCFLLPTAEEMCRLWPCTVLLQHEAHEPALCCKKRKEKKKTWNCILIHKGDSVLAVDWLCFFPHEILFYFIVENTRLLCSSRFVCSMSNLLSKILSLL